MQEGQEAASRFGVSGDESRLAVEQPASRASDSECEAILEGYRALNVNSDGGYGEFLQRAAGCTRCAEDALIPPSKQPIPALCGTAGLTQPLPPLSVAMDALDGYRRVDRSLRFNPSANSGSVPALGAFLREQGLAGLAIGHCGWGDVTARLRGRGLAEGVQLMILGADWYPLTQCANFLVERHPMAGTFTSFLRRLDPSNTPRGRLQEKDLASFFRQYRVYLGNVLLCYRTGWDKTGTKNLSAHSFENCREHLKRHIDAVAPRIVVTFGANACCSVAAVVCGETQHDEKALVNLRTQPKLKAVMERFYKDAGTGEPRGIACRRGARRIHYVPLYHPSFGHANKYDGDYAALRSLLGIEG